MQRILEKMAQKLNEYDEASLMQLWQHYAATVQDFEPSRRWEEAALALCLIQAVHWKNQLFNYNLAMTAVPPDMTYAPTVPDFTRAHRKQDGEHGSGAEPAKATVLSFPPRPANKKD
ncbi:MAG: hypothetical protein LBQ51_01910 [Desulfovibrio sp.]|jgi:hypothetical protein|nr:hypothetical protein [Desulfovibrio sp.]